MKLHGLTQPASDADIATVLLASRVVNFLRGENDPAIELPTPWEKRDPNADVTPERRAELTAQLKRRSAFAD
jgi:hypothetical protein